MNIYSILKSAGVCIFNTPEAKVHRRSPFLRGESRKMKEMEEIILMPEQPKEEKRTALQRPFEAPQAVAGVYFMACRYSPFSFV